MTVTETPVTVITSPMTTVVTTTALAEALSQLTTSPTSVIASSVITGRPGIIPTDDPILASGGMIKPDKKKRKPRTTSRTSSQGSSQGGSSQGASFTSRPSMGGPLDDLPPPDSSTLSPARPSVMRVLSAPEGNPRDNEEAKKFWRGKQFHASSTGAFYLSALANLHSFAAVIFLNLQKYPDATVWIHPLARQEVYEVLQDFFPGSTVWKGILIRIKACDLLELDQMWLREAWRGPPTQLPAPLDETVGNLSLQRLLPESSISQELEQRSRDESGAGGATGGTPVTVISPQRPVSPQKSLIPRPDGKPPRPPAKRPSGPAKAQVAKKSTGRTPSKPKPTPSPRSPRSPRPSPSQPVDNSSSDEDIVQGRARRRHQILSSSEDDQARPTGTPSHVATPRTSRSPSPSARRGSDDRGRGRATSRGRGSKARRGRSVPSASTSSTSRASTSRGGRARRGRKSTGGQGGPDDWWWADFDEPRTTGHGSIQPFVIAEDGSHHCIVCDKSFATFEEVADHIATDHPEFPPHLCAYLRKGLWKVVDPCYTQVQIAWTHKEEGASEGVPLPRMQEDLSVAASTSPSHQGDRLWGMSEVGMAMSCLWFDL